MYIFSSLPCTDGLRYPHRLLNSVRCLQEFLSQGIKKPERETDYPLPYSDEVINSAPSVRIRGMVF
jgi:hypothetical protein